MHYLVQLIFFDSKTFTEGSNTLIYILMHAPYFIADHCSNSGIALEKGQRRNTCSFVFMGTIEN